MRPLSDTHNAAPVASYGTPTTLLEVLDELDASTRQRAAMGFLQRMPHPDDDTGSLPLRQLLLAVLDIAIVDAAIVDFDAEALPISHSIRHLRRLIDMREDADRRLAIAAHHVQPADLVTLFDGIASEAHAACLPH